MHVAVFNGSPRKNGNTSILLGIVRRELEAAGVTTEEFRVGGKAVRGCIACMKCFEKQDGQCIQTGDPMNEWIAAMHKADGVILGSPTYFANVSTEMKALIDRAGMVSIANGGALRMKVGAPVVAVRRGGAQQVYNGLMAFFGIAEMVVPCSSYWNVGIGLAPGDVNGDEEGIRTMVNLGRNMAHVLKCLKSGPEAPALLKGGEV